MYGEVLSTQQLSPTIIRVVLGGGTLDQFEMTSATDAYINAKFLPKDSPLNIPFESHHVDVLSSDERPRSRRYTVRRWDQQRAELTIDFVAHGDAGYAGTWAQRAKPGDRLQFSGARGSYQPSPAVDWHLLAGDESALGAIGASIESLPQGSRAIAYVVVDTPEHEIDLPTAADVDVTWLYRRGDADPATLLERAVTAAAFPTGTFDVFVHGEAGEVRAVRKHLAGERGVDLASSSISPYWRRKHTDEAWRQVKRQWMAEQERDLVDAHPGHGAAGRP